jgi:signal transduction histidine kinase
MPTSTIAGQPRLCTATTAGIERAMLAPFRARTLSRRLLPLTAGVVVVSFVAATLYTQLLLGSDVEALDIAFNSAPSIAELADARAELRTLGHLAEHIADETDATKQARLRIAYAAERRQLEESLARYRETPFYPGESELYAEVQARLQRVDRTLGEAAADAVPVRARVDDLEAALRRLSELNRRHMNAAARTITLAERRRDAYAFLLDAIAILIAVFTVALAARTVERYMATLDRRAKELEHLAIQVGHEVANPLTPIQVALRQADESGDDGLRAATARASRSLARIRDTIGRLTEFAKAARPPAEPPGPTMLAPPLTEAASAIGVAVTVDPTWRVACAESTLRELLPMFLDGGMAAGGATPLGIEVRASPGHVRVAVRMPPDPSAVGDPFDPQLRGVASGQPGIDLRLATVRRIVEACDGRVGVRQRRTERCLWIELLRA